MSYRHGVFSGEVPTSIVPPVEVESALCVVVGCAPVHQLADWSGAVNKPLLAHTYADAVTQVGYSKDWDKYGICEQVYTHFALYGVGPLVIINVFDPDTHKTEVEAEAVTFDAEDTVTLAHAGVVGAVGLKSEDGNTTYTQGTDYTVSNIDGKVYRIPAADGGAIPESATCQAAYSYGDPTKVTEDDIIGGVDATTGASSGLELVNEVFPRYRLVPALLTAPGWSHDTGVAAVMLAKAENINGVFKALALVDIPESVDKYQDVTAWKNTANFTDESMVACWPKVTLGDDEYWLSSHLAAVMAATDANWKQVPYKSPSNERLQIDGTVIGGAEIILDKTACDYLNSQGVLTAINWIGGWKTWGNRTACYPSNTDVKDAFIPIKRMFYWYSNRLILTWFAKVDYPITRRLITTIVDSENINLNGMAAQEIILGGRIEFLEQDNPVTDLMDGTIRFHINWTPPSPAREIIFMLEYDPEYLENLFG